MQHAATSLAEENDHERQGGRITVRRPLSRLIVGVTVLATVLTGPSGQAFAAAPTGTSGHQPVIVVFDEHGNQVKDPALIARVLADRPTAPAKVSRVMKASSINDYCPRQGSNFPYTFLNE